MKCPSTTVNLPIESTALAIVMLVVAHVAAQTNHIQMSVSGSTEFNVFEPGGSFSIDVVPQVQAGSVPTNLAYQWVDFQGTALTSPVSMTAGQANTVGAPFSQMPNGYYGLRFLGSDTLFNPDTSQLNEIGFAVLPPTGPRTVHAQSRFGMVHQDLADPYINPGHVKTTASPQAWDGSSVDASFWQLLMNGVDQAGQIETPIVVDSPWDSNDAQPVPSSQLQQLGTMMGQYFAADPRPTVWELGLEENLSVNLAQQPHYFDNLAAKFQAVRQAIPAGEDRTLVYQYVSDPANPANLPFLDAFLASPAADEIDVLSVHPYDWNAFRTPEAWHGTMLQNIRQRMQQTGHGDIPIWYSEIGAPQNDAGVPDFGYPDDGIVVRGQDRDEQAVFMVKSHMLALSEGVERVYWYNYIDQLDVQSVTDPEDHFGMRDRWGFPKPAYTAYGTMLELVRDKELVSSEITGNGVYIFRFRDGDDTVAVAWSYPGGGQDVSLSELFGEPNPSLQSASRVDGSPVSVTGSSVMLGSTPFFLTAISQIDADFDNDGMIDGGDVDNLVAVIAAGSANQSFDLTGDGAVNVDDLVQWLADAGAANLASGNSYLMGDANLDGTVDGQDFLTWNASKFSSVAAWTAGDFSADGSVDGQDFLIWNANKFMSVDAIQSVPEGDWKVWAWLPLWAWFRSRRSENANLSTKPIDR